MSRPDDLAVLFNGPPGQQLGYRQGVVLAWNQTTGANTIRVEPTELTNVPFLHNTPDALILVPNDVVGILTVGTSWFILGRISRPPI